MRAAPRRRRQTCPKQEGTRILVGTAAGEKIAEKIAQMAGSHDDVAEEKCAHTLSMMRFFSHFSDVDGLIGGALELVAIAPKLLSPDVLLRERVVRQLVSLLSRPRAEAQVAACRALVAVCRFEALQQEWVAEQGVPPLCRAARVRGARGAGGGVPRGRGGGLAPRGPGGARAGGRAQPADGARARRLHPAQDEAAAALAQLGGRARAAQQAAVLRAAKGGGEGAADAIESFVLMLRRGERDLARAGRARRLPPVPVVGPEHRQGAPRDGGRLVKAGALPALRACADFWQPQVARAAAAALAALTEDAGAAVALMRATPADIEKSAGAPSMAAGGGGGLGALLTMVGSTDGATQLAALAAFGHVCAHPANTAALVRARALDRLFTFIGGALPPARPWRSAASPLCEHAAVSEGELSDERRLLPTLLSIARGSLTREGRRRCVGTRCARSGRSVGGRRSTRADRGRRAAAVAAADLRGGGAVAEQSGAARPPPPPPGAARARARRCSRRPRTRARARAAASLDRHRPRAAAVALAFLAADSSPRSTRASRREIRGRRWRRRRSACRRRRRRALGRRGASARRLARRRRGRGRRRCGEGEWRREGGGRRGGRVLGAGGRGARDEGGGALSAAGPLDGGAALGVPHARLRADDDGDEAADLDRRDRAAPPPPRPPTAAAAAALPRRACSCSTARRRCSFI